MDTNKKLKKALARVGSKRLVVRKYKGRKLTLKVRSNGFYVGKKCFPSLTSAAQAVTRTKITTGPAFWGFPAR